MTSVQELGTLANNLTHSYNDLATESCRIALACPTPQVLMIYFIILTNNTPLSISTPVCH